MTTDQDARSTVSHAQRRSRGGRVALALAVPVGVVLSGALVWQASYAAFTATDTNSGSAWTTGTVSLSDTQGGPSSGTALFTEGPLAPGDTGTKCITVTYGGSVRSDVSFDITGGGTAANDLNLVITSKDGLGQVGANCSGYGTGGDPQVNSTLAAAHTAAAVTNWTGVALNNTRTYRVTWEVNPAATTQGTTANATFTWVATSTATPND